MDMIKLYFVQNSCHILRAIVMLGIFSTVFFMTDFFFVHIVPLGNSSLLE